MNFDDCFDFQRLHLEFWLEYLEAHKGLCEEDSTDVEPRKLVPEDLLFQGSEGS